MFAFDPLSIIADLKNPSGLRSDLRSLRFTPRSGLCPCPRARSRTLGVFKSPLRFGGLVEDSLKKARITYIYLTSSPQGSLRNRNRMGSI